MIQLLKIELATLVKNPQVEFTKHLCTSPSLSVNYFNVWHLVACNNNTRGTSLPGSEATVAASRSGRMLHKSRKWRHRKQFVFFCEGRFPRMVVFAMERNTQSQRKNIYQYQLSVFSSLFQADIGRCYETNKKHISLVMTTSLKYRQ